MQASKPFISYFFYRSSVSISRLGGSLSLSAGSRVARAAQHTGCSPHHTTASSLAHVLLPSIGTLSTHTPCFSHTQSSSNDCLEHTHTHTHTRTYYCASLSAAPNLYHAKISVQIPSNLFQSIFLNDARCKLDCVPCMLVLSIILNHARAQNLLAYHACYHACLLTTQSIIYNACSLITNFISS